MNWQPRPMRIEWSDHAWEDMLHWAKNDRKMLAKVIRLIDAIRQDPFVGIGKPEPLKSNLSGFWSRRITLLYSSAEMMAAEEVSR